nr:hypothetical protein [Bacteroidota bacterium]
MPDPWPGGWWRLSDIVKYEIVSTESIIETCSENKADILKFRNDICRKAVEKGKTEMPFYYILPSEQNDHSEWIDLARLLTEHGVDVYKLTENTTLEGKNYSTGAFVVPLSQPFRPFIKEVLEIQEYPVRHYTPNGDIIKPYDITSWSLPLHKGVACYEINTLQPEIEKKLATWNLDQERSLDIPENTSAVVLNASDNSSYLAAFKAIRDGLKVFRFKRENKTTNPTISDGSFIISIANSSDAKKTNDILGVISANPVFLQNTDGFEKEEIKMPRIALVESWFHDMDAGWTRFVLDSYAIEYQVLHPEDFKKVDLDKNFDVMIFPSENKDILLSGKYKSRDGLYTPSSSPPEYAQSIGEKGFDKVLKFIDGGGKVVSWGVSTALFIGPLKIKINDEKSDEFILPVRDQSKELLGKGLYCPGSLVNIRLKKDHPITLGMESDIAVFYRGKPVFTTREPYFDMDRRVIATFPEKDILKSGYIEKEELLAGKSALVWIKKGKGQIVLFAFSPQFRASTPVSYKLLFNAILLPDFNQK